MTEQDTTVEQNEVGTADIQRVMHMIPHRYPFLMIDRVRDIRKDESAVGIKNVSINEPFFVGHFPREPVMPGVLLIESMAQTAAVLVVETLEGEAAGKLVYFMAVDEGRFRRPVYPGDTVHVNVEKIRNRGNFWKFRGDARVDDVSVAQANFSAMIRDD